MQLTGCWYLWIRITKKNEFAHLKRTAPFCAHRPGQQQGRARRPQWQVHAIIWALPAQATVSPTGSAEVYLCKPDDASPKLGLGGESQSGTRVTLVWEAVFAPSMGCLLAVFLPFANTRKIIRTPYLELNFLSPYAGDEKVPCWVPPTFLIWHRIVKTLPIYLGRKYIQKDSAFWRYKIYSGTSTVSKSVIWMSQEFYRVNNNNKSGREPKKGVNFSQHFRLQFSSHADSWILLKSQWQKSSMLNANILLSKDQGTFAWILTPYSHDKPTFFVTTLFVFSKAYEETGQARGRLYSE